MAPREHSQDRELLEWICELVESGRVRLPLTAANLYETHKVNDPTLRAGIAYTQVALSGGEVFRGRRRRLEMEIARILSEVYELPWTEPDSDWVFSTLFFEAQAELGDPLLDITISDRVLGYFRADPKRAMFDYLASIDDGVRRKAIADFEYGCEQLRRGIEDRRAKHRNESLSMRRRIYSVLLAYGDQKIMIDVADKLRLHWRCFEDRKGATMKRVINEAPAFLIEREIGLKLEQQRRAIAVNDMRDMKNFTTVLPYADFVIAEKQFVNLASQAGLATKYGSQLGTNFGTLREWILLGEPLSD
jgi:hypothetical protein